LVEPVPFEGSGSAGRCLVEVAFARAASREVRSSAEVCV
jgi:hypothetical protein